MIKCKQCNKILHSLFRHDFQKCNCPNESYVDGGKEYIRVGGMNLGDILSIHHKEFPSGVAKFEDGGVWFYFVPPRVTKPMLRLMGIPNDANIIYDKMNIK